MNIHLEGIGASPLSAHSMASSTESGQAEYQLVVKQQPDYTRIAASKEKDRKPVDPPPIVQLKVSAAKDPNQVYLQNPYFFVICSLGKGSDRDEKEPGPTALLGTLVSSIHRLKDLDNMDGGFFIFGDLSVKFEGVYRLEFTLYEIRGMACVKLASTTSNPFQVYGTKNFPGMCQSTVITRNFSDQGVRLRLRKDSRQMSTRKRNDETARITVPHFRVQREPERSQQGRRGSGNAASSNPRTQSTLQSVTGPSPSTSSARSQFPPQSSAYYDQATGYPATTANPYGQQQYSVGAIDHQGLGNKRPRLSQGQSTNAYQSVSYRQLSDASDASNSMSIPSQISTPQAYATPSSQMLGGITYPPHSMGHSMSALGFAPHRTLPPPQPNQPSLSTMAQPGITSHLHQGSPVGNPTASQIWNAHDLYRSDGGHQDHGYS